MKLRLLRDEETISVFELEDGAYVVGSGESAALRIENESIAPEHVRLRVLAGALDVEDLGSGRGTWIGGRALTGVARLPDGVILQLGLVGLQAGDDLAPALPAPRPGRYVPGAVVASGGMGVIRSALDIQTGRVVAMKRIREGMDDADLLTRFELEARITAHLEHPNIVPVHDVHPGADGPGYYTMKMVRGASLEKLIRLISQQADPSVGQYPLDALLTVFQKIADAVAFAHSRGVIHRDLKPANIMVGDYGEVLVMDWGLAKVAGTGIGPAAGPASSAALDGGTLAGEVMGTPHYMAPEQASGQNEQVDERSDVYALGAILYELLTLQTPVGGRTAGEIIRKVRAGRIVPPIERLSRRRLRHLPGGMIPASLDAVAMKALAVSPQRRYQRVQDLQAEIQTYKTGFATAAEQAGPGRQFLLLVRRNRGVAGAMAACAAMLALLTAASTVSIRHETGRSRAEYARASGARAATDIQNKRAQEAEARVQKSALFFAAKSDDALKNENLAEALKRLGMAIAVAPQNPEYFLRRADLLQANGRFTEAIPDYERSNDLRPDQSVRDTLALTRRLLQENGGEPTLRPEVRRQLIAALVAQGRGSQALSPPPAPVAAAPAAPAPPPYTPAEEALHVRLGSFYTSQPGWNRGRISTAADGGLRLDLNGMKLSSLSTLRGLRITTLFLGSTGITDLAPLAGLPLNQLVIQHNGVKDLSPLAGMKLTELFATATGIADLRPLRGMPLRVLHLHGSPVSDLTPLAGMPLESLYLEGTPCTDLAALKGMPIRALGLLDTKSLQDFSPLSTLLELDAVNLPVHATKLGFLSALPKLHNVHNPRFARGNLPVAAYCGLSNASDAAWTKWASALRATGAASLPPHRLTVDARGVIELDLRDTPARNFTPLAGMPEFRLLLNNPARLNLTPLQGSSLVDLDVSEAAVTSLLPLFKCSKLDSLTINRTAADVHLLRQHPTLRHLDYQSDPDLRRPKTTVREFFSPSPPGTDEGRLQSGNALAADLFDAAEAFTTGWTCINGRGEPATVGWSVDPRSQGGRGGGHLSFIERRGDNSPGQFSAPPRFLGNQKAAYGGTLQFRMRHQHGPGAPANQIKLRSGSHQLSYALRQGVSREWTFFSIPLHETGGWKRDDEGGRSASAEEMQQVLENLDQLLIPAEFTRHNHELTDLDEVSLTTAEQDRVEHERQAALAAQVTSMAAAWDGGRWEDAITLYRDLRARTRIDAILESAHAVFARSLWKTVWFKSSVDPVGRLGEWRALARGPAAAEAEVPAIAFHFDDSSPGQLGLSNALNERDPGRENFGMIATTRLRLPPGQWRFTVRSDDGCRVLVNGKELMHKWYGHYPESIAAIHKQLESSEAEVVVEYFQYARGASIALTLEPLLPEPAPGSGTTPPVPNERNP